MMSASWEWTEWLTSLLAPGRPATTSYWNSMHRRAPQLLKTLCRLYLEIVGEEVVVRGRGYLNLHAK